MSDTEAEFGPVDILVNNAGIMYYTMMVNQHEQEWHRQIDLNCKVRTFNLFTINLAKNHSYDVHVFQSKYFVTQDGHY